MDSYTIPKVNYSHLPKYQYKRHLNCPEIINYHLKCSKKYIIKVIDNYHQKGLCSSNNNQVTPQAHRIKVYKLGIRIRKCQKYHKGEYLIAQVSKLNHR